jgi:hypothetical protein
MNLNDRILLVLETFEYSRPNIDRNPNHLQPYSLKIYYYYYYYYYYYVFDIILLVYFTSDWNHLKRVKVIDPLIVFVTINI